MSHRTLQYLPVPSQLTMEHDNNGAVRVFVPLSPRLRRWMILFAGCSFIYVVLETLSSARTTTHVFGRLGLGFSIVLCLAALVMDLVLVRLLFTHRTTIIEADANGMRVSQENSKRVVNWSREKIKRIRVRPMGVLSNLAVQIGYDPVRLVAFWHDRVELEAVADALRVALNIESSHE